MKLKVGDIVTLIEDYDDGRVRLWTDFIYVVSRTLPSSNKEENRNIAWVKDGKYEIEFGFWSSRFKRINPIKRNLVQSGLP